MARKIGLLLFFAIVFVIWTLPATASPERQPLTLELLQDRINHPVTLDGRAMIDLRRLTIDFAGESPELKVQFFSLLQNRLNRTTQAIGIDLSDSLIDGDFSFRDLGLSTRLVRGALPQILTPEEQQQLEKDLAFVQSGNLDAVRINVFRGSLRLHNTIFTGQVDFSRMFFLRPVEAIATQFTEASFWQDTRLGQLADFSQAIFWEEANFRESAFFGFSKFNGANFRSKVDFSGATFKNKGTFDRVQFDQLANFTELLALDGMAFNQAVWRDRVLLSKSRFFEPLSLAGSTFEKSVSFRSSRFSQMVDLQDVKLLGQMDFGDAIFFPYAKLNLAGFAFDSEQAKILGETGAIGQVFSLPKLAGNEAVVRNLVRNFRDLEQIPDANAIEYKAKTLELNQLTREVLRFPLQGAIADRLGKTVRLLLLSALLLLSNYGTNLGLIWGVGIVAIAFFGALFWAIDRWRRRTPTPILPDRYDSICVLGSFGGLMLLGLGNILKASNHSLSTLLFLGVILLPLPLGLAARLYLKGRFHNGMDSSYFLMDGSTRELRLLIVRFPVVPEFVFFRDRYTPLVWSRRWNWLNYFDFSCNNWLKIGFNDIRLRDRDLPGVVSILAWYQWGLGLIYISLLLWTLSRTIPGLNLLIYLK
jgi:uncharacterized protein YjbI with pentapeptide repeats